MISLCCVGVASVDVVCDKLNDFAWDLVCSSFLIVCVCLSPLGPELW